MNANKPIDLAKVASRFGAMHGQASEGLRSNDPEVMQHALRRICILSSEFAQMYGRDCGGMSAAEMSKMYDDIRGGA